MGSNLIFAQMVESNRRSLVHSKQPGCFNPAVAYNDSAAVGQTGIGEAKDGDANSQSAESDAFAL